jgi:hypothetical protein
MNQLTTRKPYQTDLLPRFVLPLSKLLFEADRWKRNQKRLKQSRKPNPPSGGTDG